MPAAFLPAWNTGSPKAMNPCIRRVTVGLPVYNGERYLRETLDSILKQSFADFELVVSDNASTDGTEEICCEYVRLDPRVRYFRNAENRGAAWNHNHLVELARGSLFKWAGADDLYEPQFLARCIEALDKHPDAVLAYPRTIAINEVGVRLYDYSPAWDLESDSPSERLRAVILKGGHWVNADAISGVIRMEALRLTRLIPSYLGGDKRPLGELSLLGKFIEVPECLLLRRFHPDSSGIRNPSSTGYEQKSVAWMIEFFKGSAMTTCLPSWVLLRDHLRTIWSSSVPAVQKLRLSSALARACYWHREFFLGELKNVLRLPFRSRLARAD